jgi:hypothetical protein
LKTSQPALSYTDLKFAIEIASRIPHVMGNAKIAWDAFSNADNGRILALQQVRLGAEKSEYLLGAPGLYIGVSPAFSHAK